MATNMNQTLVGPKTVLRDNTVTIDENLMIEGQIIAKRIDAGPHTVVIGAGAEVIVDNEIIAGEIIVLGKVKGELRAQKEITIAKTGSVEGNVIAPRIHLDPTASVTGSLRH